MRTTGKDKNGVTFIVGDQVRMDVLRGTYKVIDFHSKEFVHIQNEEAKLYALAEQLEVL